MDNFVGKGIAVHRWNEQYGKNYEIKITLETQRNGKVVIKMEDPLCFLADNDIALLHVFKAFNLRDPKGCIEKFVVNDGD